MCLAVSGKIIKKLDKNQATVDFDGVKRQIDISLIKNPKIGDYVLVHVGFAIQKVSRQSAKASQEAYKEINSKS